MKVMEVERVTLEQPMQLYDLQNTEHNNFVIQGKKYDYVAHNCG